MVNISHMGSDGRDVIQLDDERYASRSAHVSRAVLPSDSEPELEPGLETRVNGHKPKLETVAILGITIGVEVEYVPFCGQLVRSDFLRPLGYLAKASN